MADEHQGTVALGIRHVLCVPLRLVSYDDDAEPDPSGERHLGVLYLDSREKATLLASSTGRSGNGLRVWPSKRTRVTVPRRFRALGFAGKGLSEFLRVTRCFLRRLLRLAGTSSVIMWKNRLDVLLTIGEAVLFVSAVGSALFVAALAFDLFC